MAERRMFHTAVVESDAFLDMPIGAQALYFHLGMQADDDGFINCPRQVVRKIGRPAKELQLLEDLGFILNFDGIVVIRHWRISNTLQNDRIKPFRYPELAKMLYMDETKAYTLEGTEEQNVYKWKNNFLESNWNPIGILKEKKGKEKKGTEKKINESNPAEHNRKEGERISPLRCASVEMTGEGGVPTPVSFADTPSEEGGMPTPVSSADTPSGEGVTPTPVSSADTPSPEGVRGAVLDGGAVAAHVPAYGVGGERYDESYVLLHRFGKGLVKLTANQIDGLRRIMEETELDGYVYQLAKQIESGDDPGAHYTTIKNWYLERNGKYA